MVTLPPRRAKLHYTFDNSSLEEIGKTNFALLSKLNSIATRAPVFGEGKAAKTSPKVFKPRGATERERRAAQIDRDNLCVLPSAPLCARVLARTAPPRPSHATHPPSFNTPPPTGQYFAAQDPVHKARGDQIHAGGHFRAQPALGTGGGRSA